MVELEEQAAIEPLQKLSKDLKLAARLIKTKEARYLVGLYYQVQKLRTITSNQVDQVENLEPSGVLRWIANNTWTIERNIKTSMGIFAGSYRVGAWMQSITGIGEILSAGFLSHLDIRRAPTASNLYSYCGINPKQKWYSAEDAKRIYSQESNRMGVKAPFNEEFVAHVEKVAEIQPGVLGRRKEFLFGKRDDGVPLAWTTDRLSKAICMRPHNEFMHVLCYKLGDCFIKNQNHKNDYYGKYYVMRRAQEDAKSESGQFKDQAAAVLERKKLGKETEARKAYEKGELPDAHLLARARRWAVKLFLSHLHTAMYEDYYGKAAPVPYCFSDHIGERHQDYLKPPGWEDFKGREDLKGLRDLLS